MSLLHRQNNVLAAGASSSDNATFGNGYTVTVYSVGAVASAASSDSTPDVDKGHSFVALDKVLIWDGTTSTYVAEALSSVAAAQLTWSSATPTIAKGNLLVNLGPDGGVSAPDYDESKVVIYSDADGSDVVTNSELTTDSQGNYDYYHRGDGLFWEVIRDSGGTVAAVIPGWGGHAGRLNIADYGCAIDGSTDDAKTLQATFDAANALGGMEVFHPGGHCLFGTAQTLYPNLIISGVGCGPHSAVAGTFGSQYECSAGGFAFFYQTANGTSSFQGPKFRDFRLLAENGIQLNDPSNGFTDDGSSQSYIMRPEIRDCVIEARTAGSGDGIEWSMVFDGSITNTYVRRFSVGIDFHGSDINTVSNNRVVGYSSGDGVALIRLTAYSTFGSQNRIVNNDLLSLADHANAVAMVVAGDRAPRIVDNYFELTGTYTNKVPAIKVVENTGGSPAQDDIFYIVIKDNRMDISTSTSSAWLALDNQDFASLIIDGNWGISGTWAPATISGDVLYEFNATYPKVIDIRGTDVTGLPIIQRTHKHEWPGVDAAITPKSRWATSGTYATSLAIVEDAFVIPELAGTGSNVIFTLPKDNAGNQLTGTFNVSVIAKADTAAQTCTFAWHSDAAGAADGSEIITLSTGWRKYDLFDGPITAATKLGINVNNPTTSQGADVHIRQILLEIPGVGEAVDTLANDATPTVLHGHLFKTGGTTTITDFDDGVVGQEIQILSEHDITITDGAPIVLHGSANFVMASGDTLTLRMFNDQVWQETGRTVNL